MGSVTSPAGLPLLPLPMMEPRSLLLPKFLGLLDKVVSSSEAKWSLLFSHCQSHSSTYQQNLPIIQLLRVSGTCSSQPASFGNTKSTQHVRTRMHTNRQCLVLLSCSLSYSQQVANGFWNIPANHFIE
jgi:hypothetical protein